MTATLARLPAADTLRVATSGSVDDGKSTLIGRLLFDSKSLLADQLATVQRDTARRGASGVDLALLTDGLTAEREQGITIDVAYRYFATARRRFILADTPGHEQYTRNMVTGASQADLAIILVDARSGILPQTKRHAALVALLRIPHVALAVNKMDLVDFDRGVFERVRDDFLALTASLGFEGVTSIPLSALEGDMVVDRGEHLGWYQGPTLLEFLESVTTERRVTGPWRFPVQLVSRSRYGARNESRGYLGRIENGAVEVGDEIRVWPSGVTARIAQIVTLDGSLDIAGAGRSVSLILDRQVDVARGDLLTHAKQAPVVTDRFAARLAWLSPTPLDTRRAYLVKHGTAVVKARIAGVDDRLDIQTLQPIAGPATLGANDIGRVRVETARALPLDRYAEVRATGSFLLIDEATNATVAAGLVEELAHG
ncbi:sulfate adenylyltransferase subunit 1 [Usitatibacter palustris]|uniref:sulfate adenylyltransferase n=1 Tax=Usitatibacter palustris TaxID=2732487 RepID=A0A6M4H9Q6_9PROT|nr:GTP-binding protein [Usitatibacter palustris]QJR15598.1 Bifunctional enzyme CysN/CysC [Usitatibacter palustris]